MKLRLIALIAMLSSQPAWAESEYIEQVPDRIFTIDEPRDELMKRAESCIMKTIRNDEVRTKGSSDGHTGLFTIRGRMEAIATIAAGPVIKYKDIEAGTYLINNRVDFTSDLGLDFSVQTSMELSIKDGKFKIGNKDIMYLQKDTGFGSPPEYKPLPRSKFSSNVPRDAVDAIRDVTKKLAICMSEPTASDDW